MNVEIVSSPDVIEIITEKHHVEVITTPGLIATIDSAGGGAVIPVGGMDGQVLTKRINGPEWSSLMDLTLWFENQLLE